MPELPEVETVKRGLKDLIIGKVVKSESHDTERGFPNLPEEVASFLIDSEITNIRRRAKVLMIDLSTGYSLVIHLKMTGQIVYVGDERFGAGHPNDSLVDSLPDKSTRVTITFTDKTQLFFNDQRKFGWMKLMPTTEIPNINFMQKVGPEPLESSFTAEQFIDRFSRKKNSNIKAALLDQTVVAGIGNIYADESLWGAKIHPARLVKEVNSTELRDLYQSVRDILSLSIEKGGSSSRNYVNAEGGRGSYLDFANVYKRDGQPCRRCDTIILKTKLAGRGTHYCPNCQVR